jgi:AAA+ superfamily predicted ATPase
MDLNDFGTQSNAPPRPAHPDGPYFAADRNYTLPEGTTAPVQWKVSMRGIYEACGTTHRQLPAGAYTCCLNQFGEPQLLAKDLQVDDLIDFANSLPSQILLEIQNFWSLGETFQRYGYLHRRGYLLYGPQGSGKSSVVHQVVHRIIDAGHIAVFCEHPGILTRSLELFRKIEPQRPLVCMFEDIDAIIEVHGDSELLQWLDGSHQINKVINIATTNYPEHLDRRIVARPRRFDRIIKIEAPDDSMRKVYFTKKLPEFSPAELDRWVSLTKGLSFAALAELVISVACLGNSLEDTIKILGSLNEQQPSSREFDRPVGLGFAANPSRRARGTDDVPF